MFNKGDHIKKLNMKVAGTLVKPKVNSAAHAVEDDGKDGKVWDVNMEGLTAKQKKNLRKKLQRKRRRQAQQGQDSDADSDIVEGENTVENQKLNGKENGVKNSQPNHNSSNIGEVAKKKHAKKGSIGNGHLLDKKLDGLLLDVEGLDSQANDASKEPPKTSRRGPKIDENV